MPFSSNPLMAPVFQSPVGDRRDHKPPVVSIKRAEDSMESGIRLHHNQAREGYILQPEVEGLGVAPVELQTAPLASGGSVARHSRLAEGDVFLPITLVSPVPSALPGMFDALVDIVRPGQLGDDGLPLQFEVVVFDPYGQETRSRRLIFESGLGDPVRVNHHIWRTSITGRFVDPFWYGQVRELRRTLGSVDKKFITAKQGPPDPESPPAVTYEWEGEPHASPSVKRVGGQVVARNRVYTNPSSDAGVVYDEFRNGELNEISTAGATPPYVGYGTGVFPVTAGDFFAHAATWKWTSEGNIGRLRHQIQFRGPNNESISAPQTIYERSDYPSGGRAKHVFQVPEGATEARIYDWFYIEGSFTRPEEGSKILIGNFSVADGATEAKALEQAETYFDGDTPDVPSRQIGGYEFPFFPVRIGGSVVQGEYELQVEGDAPAYWSGVITPPGEDLLIQNAAGERIFVKGRVDEPILIQTRPQEQDITLADGTPIWDRIDPGDDDFFPLNPGLNTVHVSMVGATQQSEILIRYREAFSHSLGGGS